MPDTLRALAGQVEAVLAETHSAYVAECERNGWAFVYAEVVKRQADAVLAAIERAAEDTARLDWLEANSCLVEPMNNGTGRDFRITDENDERGIGPTIRAAIDAARSTSGEPTR